MLAVPVSFSSPNSEPAQRCAESSSAWRHAFKWHACPTCPKIQAHGQPRTRNKTDIYDIYAAAEPNTTLTKIGVLNMRTPFVKTKFGDTKLFFRSLVER